MTIFNRSSPMVSIVLPTYNRVSVLRPVIVSILNQDFDDLELVIIDDGSTDDTPAAVREMQERDARLRYVPLPHNRGVGFARDAGLRYAPGAYIALADSDDPWLPGRLRAQIGVLEKYLEIDILFGSFLNIDHVMGTQKPGFTKSGKGMDHVTTRPLEGDLFLVESGMDIGILKSNFIATATMVLRREVFDRVGGFNIHLKSPELEFCWRAAFWGARYAYLDRPLIERHRLADGLTTQGDRPWLARLEAIAVMRRVCQNAGRRESLPHIHATEVRTYRNLLRIYGETGHPVKVIRTFIRSLRCGVSARTSALFLAALPSPRVISRILRLRRTLSAAHGPVGVGKIRICLLHHYYLPIFSGAAIRSHNQARIMVGEGHDLWVLTPRYPDLAKEEVLDGIRVIRPCVLGRTRAQRFLTFMLSATKELVRHREEYDLLHLFDFGPFDIIPVLVAKALGKHVLYQMTLMPHHSYRVTGRKCSALVRMGLRLVDGFIVLSSPMLRALRAVGLCNRPVKILPNGVDTARYRPALPSERAELRKELGLEQSCKYVSFVGSVVERKGVGVLVSAFQEVAAAYADARLLVIGPDTFVRPGFEDETNQRAQAFAEGLKKRVQTVGLAGRVIFTGRSDQVPDYLRASDVFVFPSRREGFPSVVIQAMATALPCIVAELDGISADMICHGLNGYIIQGHDPSRYAERIIKILAAPAEAERIGRAARSWVEQRFRLDDVVEQYVAFCEELLSV